MSILVNSHKFPLVRGGGDKLVYYIRNDKEKVYNILPL